MNVLKECVYVGDGTKRNEGVLEITSSKQKLQTLVPANYYCLTTAWTTTSQTDLEKGWKESLTTGAFPATRPTAKARHVEAFLRSDAPATHNNTRYWYTQHTRLHNDVITSHSHFSRRGRWIGRIYKRQREIYTTLHHDTLRSQLQQAANVRLDGRGICTRLCAVAIAAAGITTTAAAATAVVSRGR